MKILHVVIYFCLVCFLIPVFTADAQINVNSVSISGEARSFGDSSQGIADDFD